MREQTAISRKVVGKSARGNPERYCGWFLIHCFSKKFQTMAREAMDVCLRVLKESNKTRFDSYSVRKSVLIISHITFRDCRVHSFSDHLSRNSCIRTIDSSPDGSYVKNTSYFDSIPALFLLSWYDGQSLNEIICRVIVHRAWISESERDTKRKLRYIHGSYKFTDSKVKMWGKGLTNFNSVKIRTILC